MWSGFDDGEVGILGFSESFEQVEEGCEAEKVRITQALLNPPNPLPNSSSPQPIAPNPVSAHLPHYPPSPTSPAS